MHLAHEMVLFKCDATIMNHMQTARKTNLPLEWIEQPHDEQNHIYNLINLIALFGWYVDSLERMIHWEWEQTKWKKKKSPVSLKMLICKWQIEIDESEKIADTRKCFLWILQSQDVFLIFRVEIMKKMKFVLNSTNWMKAQQFFLSSFPFVISFGYSNDLAFVIYISFQLR